ncbi:MAG: hypothetical protein E7B59_12585 [Enterobacteriaceae bacterium]|nr:hypothetical protein [Enterobacteriaceae bacterium]
MSKNEKLLIAASKLGMHLAEIIEAEPEELSEENGEAIVSALLHVIEKNAHLNLVYS